MWVSTGPVAKHRYALQEQLGWGTFGRVYRAVDERGNVWAVHNVNKPSQQAQKVVEALRAVAELGCPFLLALEDVYVEEKCKRLVTRLPRESLRDRISTGRYTVAMAATWGRQLAQALAALRQPKLHHREVTLDHVWLGVQDEVLVGEWRMDNTAPMGQEDKAPSFFERDVTFEVDDTEHILNDAPVTPRGAASALAKVPGFDREELWSYGVIMYQVGTKSVWHAHCRHLSASAVKEEVVLASIQAAFRESTEGHEDQEQGDEATCRILAKVIATALRPGKEHTPEDIVSMIPLDAPEIGSPSGVSNGTRGPTDREETQHEQQQQQRTVHDQGSGPSEASSSSRSFDSTHLCSSESSASGTSIPPSPSSRSHPTLCTCCSSTPIKTIYRVPDLSASQQRSHHSATPAAVSASQKHKSTQKSPLHSILAAVQQEKDAKIRQRALVALAKLGPKAAHPQVVQVLEQLVLGASEAAERRLATLALGSMGPKAAEYGAVKPLIRALVDSEAGVRTGAAWSLGSLGKSAEERGASVALLHRSLKDEDAQVRAMSSKALKILHSCGSKRKAESASLPPPNPQRPPQLRAQASPQPDALHHSTHHSTHYPVRASAPQPRLQVQHHSAQHHSVQHHSATYPTPHPYPKPKPPPPPSVYTQPIPQPILPPAPQHPMQQPAHAGSVHPMYQMPNATVSCAVSRPAQAPSAYPRRMVFQGGNANPLHMATGAGHAQYSSTVYHRGA